MLELCSPWLSALTRCGGCIGCVCGRWSVQGGADGVVVNRLKKLFCGLRCIHIALHPPVAHAYPMPEPLWNEKQKAYMAMASENITALQFDQTIKIFNEIKDLGV